MVWAAGLVCDVVSLQKLLELLGIVAWTIITSDNVEQANSVTIIYSSAQMAADVEFGNFLTRKYFEKTSATIRKSILFQ